jgi:lauroyl/myristoyl acyltransferase
MSPSGPSHRGLLAVGTETTWFRYVPLAALKDRLSGETVAFFDRGTLRPTPRRRFSEADLLEILLRAVFWATVWLLPISAWARVAGATSRLRRFRHIRRKRPTVIKAAVASGLVSDSKEGARLYDAYRRRLHERRLMFLRERARPDPVAFDVEGLDALERVLAEGRGAILWTSPFAFQTLIGKRGVHEAGQHIVQISARQHGFSDTDFGIRYLNTPLVREENRYLADRLILEKETAATVLRGAVRVMKSGGAVYFTNNVYAGKSFIQVPFGPAAWFMMPQTPLFLARRYGFALFAVETVETKPFSAYSIRLTECTVPLDAELTDHEAVARGALAVRDVMFAGARRAPDQFMGLVSIHDSPLIRIGSDIA